MAFHVPFNQRPSGQQPLPGPIYIGFDVPAPTPRRQFNWWGFNGMWMSFASLMTAGFLSPISLLVSLKGLRRPGKKMAGVGTVVSLAGMALATLIVFAGYHGHRQHHEARQARKQAELIKEQIADVKKTVAVAITEIEEFKADNEGQFPSDVDGNMLVIKYEDPWGEALRFDLEENKAIIRSAGPDKKFYTKDDVAKDMQGSTERNLLGKSSAQSAGTASK
jgi:hypothetical protein